MLVSTNFINLFYLGSACFSFLACLLLWKNSIKLNSLANKVLALFFFSIGYSILGYLMIISGWIVYVPMMYKTPLPFSYLIYPLLFLYVQIILANKSSIHKYQLFHFLPFLLAIIDLFPFYLVSLEEKKTIVSNLVRHFSNSYLVDSGFLPPWMHYLLKQIQSFIYIILLWKMLLQYKIFIKLKVQEAFIASQLNEVKNWLIAISSWMTFSYLSFVTLMVLTFFNQGHQISGVYTEVASLIFAISIFALCAHVFFHPNVLYGFITFDYETKNKPTSNNSVQNPENNTLKLSTEQWLYIEDEIKNKKYYKKKGMSIDRLAIELEMSTRQLSFCINFYNKMKFQDYINSIRLEYVIQEFEKGALENNTIESIGIDAGFGSRSAFFSVFKKHKGCTPLVYIKNKL
jgi:AraC-like DNA-binding protein